MGVIGGNGFLQTAEYFGGGTALSFNGNNYALLISFQAEWGTKLARKYVSNSNVPMYYNTEYDGTAEMEVMMSSDQLNQITGQGTISQGAAPQVTLSFQLSDKFGNLSTWNFLVVVEKSRISWQDNKEIIIKASLAIIGTPVKMGTQS